MSSFTKLVGRTPDLEPISPDCRDLVKGQVGPATRHHLSASVIWPETRTGEIELERCSLAIKLKDYEPGLNLYGTDLRQTIRSLKPVQPDTKATNALNSAYVYLITSSSEVWVPFNNGGVAVTTGGTSRNDSELSVLVFESIRGMRK